MIMLRQYFRQMNVNLREKWIGIEPRELGKSSAKRNRKLKLIKGTKKQEKTEKETNLIEGETVNNRYESRNYYHREEQNNFTF